MLAAAESALDPAAAPNSNPSPPPDPTTNSSSGDAHSVWTQSSPSALRTSLEAGLLHTENLFGSVTDVTSLSLVVDQVPNLTSADVLDVFSPPNSTLTAHEPQSQVSHESTLSTPLFTSTSPEGLAEETSDTSSEPVSARYREYFNLSNITNYVRDTDDGALGNSSDDCRFQSFEEWKRMKQAEIEAESSALAESSKRTLPEPPLLSTEPAESNPPQKAAPVVEDQGKTYKDKFNYASVDCAATVVKTNKDVKGASAILTEVKDSYLLNKCSTTNKFIVIELCQDILVGSVVMANYELFSSMFRTVRFSVSDKFPANGDEWQELGQFEAVNVRDTQVFDIENPLIWARYLKIEILSHFGSEFYCPISLVRVHGTTMMEDFKNNEVPSLKTTESKGAPKQMWNYTSDFDTTEECKALSPYLALNEFLRELNSSEHCFVDELAVNNKTATAIETATTKTTQESIFQNIMKRLSRLESNATLSLLYVEEQSKLLSDAFLRLEARQVKKFETLLSQFNQTIHSQVAFLEHAADNIQTDARNVVKLQVERSKEKMRSLATQMSFLKAIVIIDTIIILSLLAYVIVTRETLLPAEPVDKHVEPHNNFIRPFPMGGGKMRGKKRRKQK